MQCATHRNHARLTDSARDFAGFVAMQAGQFARIDGECSVQRLPEAIS